MNLSESSLSITAKRIKHILGVDRAIGLTILGRCFTLPAGVLTVILISRLMSPIEQGYYYSIWSLWALQIVFELGFSFVILMVAAHERACLTVSEDGTLQGDLSSIKRLAGLLRTVQRWYLVAALTMVAALFSPRQVELFAQQIQQRNPWFNGQLVPYAVYADGYRYFF